MNDQVCERFFLSPDDPWHRRYEALRAVFVERCSLKEVAQRCDVGYGTMRNWVSDFRRQCHAGEVAPFLSNRPADVHVASSKRKNRISKSPT